MPIEQERKLTHEITLASDSYELLQGDAENGHTALPIHPDHSHCGLRAQSRECQFAQFRTSGSRVGESRINTWNTFASPIATIVEQERCHSCFRLQICQPRCTRCDVPRIAMGDQDGRSRAVTRTIPAMESRLVFGVEEYVFELQIFRSPVPCGKLRRGEQEQFIDGWKLRPVMLGLV